MDKVKQTSIAIFCQQTRCDMPLIYSIVNTCVYF